MRRPISLVSLPLLLALMTACGSSDNPTTLVTRDSSGVTILSYPASAWDSTSHWAISDKPLLQLGGDSVDATMNLSSTVAGTLLADGRAVVSTNNPAELLLFSPAGSREARLGAPGNGPGEFQVVSRLFPIGADTIFAFDATQMKGLTFAANGMPLGERVLPPVNARVPASLRGRLQDGTFLFTLDMTSDSAPAGPPKPYRNRLVVLGLNPRTDRYDTLAVSRGVEMVTATTMLAGQATSIPKPVIFGAVPQVVAGTDRWYLSAGDQMEVEVHDASGKLLRVVRMKLPERAVVAADQEKYKATVREAYGRMKGMVPPDVMDAELKKVDETVFAEKLPPVAQLLTDNAGNFWVNRGFSLLDKVRSWIIFNANGEAIGRVDTPLGSVLAIAGDRILLRREDTSTGMIALEVYRLTRPAAVAPKP